MQNSEQTPTPVMEIPAIHGPQTHLDLASKYLAKNDPETAWEYAKKAVSMIEDGTKSDILIHGLLLSGEAALRSGQQQQAIVCFERVQQILPEFPGLVDFLFNVDLTDVIDI